MYFLRSIYLAHKNILLGHKCKPNNDKLFIVHIGVCPLRTVCSFAICCIVYVSYLVSYDSLSLGVLLVLGSIQIATSNCKLIYFHIDVAVLLVGVGEPLETCGSRWISQFQYEMAEQHNKYTKYNTAAKQ